MIVRCAEPSDVVQAIAFARAQSLDVAVRSGGHDLLGASVCDGMVIDLSPMKRAAIDGQRQTARVEAGIRAGELNDITQAHSLVATLGCNPAVGVSGLTLGGGLGWFLGKYGAACDSLLAADVVTAEGKLLRASETENADLFWAIRGGGGNFGIITAMDFQLHSVRNVLGGVLAYRTDVGRFLHFYRDYMKAAPDELAVELNIIVADPPITFAIVCWSGDEMQGKRVLRPLQSFGPPIADTIDVVSYLRLTERFPDMSLILNQPPSGDRRPLYNYWRGGSLPALSHAAAEEIAAAVHVGPRGSTVGLGHYLHGRICKVPKHSTPLERKQGQLTYFFSVDWSDPHQGDVVMEWVNHSLQKMKHFSGERAYINYLSTNSNAAIKASYAGSYASLARLKRKYDPTNFFRSNRNILPA